METPSPTIVGDDIVWPSWKHGAVMHLYEIRNTVNTKVYVGITRTTVKQRWASHKHSSKQAHSLLYNAMRKHGLNNFYIVAVKTLTTEEDLLQAEKDLIAVYKDLGLSYNILDGGESYFPIVDKEAWKAKLRVKRVGRTPALGMRHTEENKKKFSAMTLEYYLTHRQYFPEDLVNLSFKEAHLKYGISKTHFYRLLKRVKSNELS
jgi:group I intron endonuclease